MTVRPKWMALGIHGGVWLALVVAANLTAGSYSVAFCWYILPLYIPPLSFLLVGFMVTFPIATLVMLFDDTMRGSRAFFVTSHGTVFSIGILASTWVARLVAPQASCL